MAVDGSTLNKGNNDSLLLSIMNSKTVVGLPTRFGGDTVASTSGNNVGVPPTSSITNVGEDEPDELEEQDDEELRIAENEELNWGDFSAGLLRTPLNPQLQTRIARPTQQTWSSRRRPVATSINASALSKEYSALAKLKFECVQLEMAKIKQETIQSDLESQLRQEILKVELEMKKIALNKALQN